MFYPFPAYQVNIESCTCAQLLFREPLGCKKKESSATKKPKQTILAVIQFASTCSAAFTEVSLHLPIHFGELHFSGQNRSLNISFIRFWVYHLANRLRIGVCGKTKHESESFLQTTVSDK